MGYQNLIAALGSTDPQALSSLRSRHVDNEALFSTAKYLGSDDSSPAASREAEASHYAAMLELAQASAQVVQKRLDSLLAHVLHRMTLASRIKLVGAIAATTSGLVRPSL